MTRHSVDKKFDDLELADAPTYVLSSRSCDVAFCRLRLHRQSENYNNLFNHNISGPDEFIVHHSADNHSAEQRFEVERPNLAFQYCDPRSDSHCSRQICGRCKTGSNTCAEGGFTYDFATYPHIEVVFENSKLTGWNVQSGSYNTPSGVHIGTPRTNLLTIYREATVDDQSTVGPTWNYNGISGTFTNNKVSFIYSGTTCIIT